MKPEDLLTIASGIVEEAADTEQIEVACSHSRSANVRAYDGKVESFTKAEDFAIGVRVLVEGREGFATAGTLDRDVVSQVLSDARDNARFAESDEHVGIAQPDGVEPVEIDLWKAGVSETSNADKIQKALEIEERVRDADPRITGIRVASYGDSEGSFALASTAGIRAATKASSAGVSVQALAVDGERTQAGYGYDGARDPGDLKLDKVVDRAVSHTVDLIGATKPKSGTVDLVLDPHLTATVIGLIADTLTADVVLKGRSPFAERVGETIGSEMISFVDDPTDPLSLGADSHDGEGLACRPVSLVESGVLKGYLHDSYTGRRSGEGSTGSAVRGTRGLPGPGVQALKILPGSGSLEETVEKVDDGIFVFNLAGLHSGVNPVSGDFSVGVEGRIIRDGKLAEPVSECTIASTLQRMLLDVKHVGGDLEYLPSGITAPSLIIGGVTLSGDS